MPPILIETDHLRTRKDARTILRILLFVTGIAGWIVQWMVAGSGALLPTISTLFLFLGATDFGRSCPLLQAMVARFGMHGRRRTSPQPDRQEIESIP